MNTGKYVFAQVLSFIDPNDFKNCVDWYSDNYKIKKISCWHQLSCMMFWQLANRENQIDLILCLQVQKSKWHHFGIGCIIPKLFAYANEKEISKYFPILPRTSRQCLLPENSLAADYFFVKQPCWYNCWLIGCCSLCLISDIPTLVVPDTNIPATAPCKSF